MRIVITTPWMGFWEVGTRGGVADEYHTVAGLLARGHEVHLVAPAGAEYAVDAHADRFHAHHVSYPATRWRGRWGQLGRLYDAARGWRAWRRQLGAIGRHVAPELILAHSFHTVPGAAAVARRLGVPCVGKFFGVLELDTRWQPRWLHWLRHFEHYAALRSELAHVIVLDDGTRGDRAALRLGVPGERLSFWPNGVDVDWATTVERDGGGSIEHRRALGLPADRTLVMTLCNLLPLKRVDRMLEAVAQVPEVDAVVAGDGAQRRELEEFAIELGMAERTHFVGAVDHDRVPEWMHAVDLYVAPHDLTNAGLPTVEAMLCGLPVVALDIGDTSRLVRHGETGIVVPLDIGPMGLATAIRRLAHDPELRRAYGARGRQQALAGSVSWRERVRMEVELLERVAAGGEPAGGTTTELPPTP